MQTSYISEITIEEESSVRRMLQHYFKKTEAENCSISRLSGGMNNATYLIHGNQQHYVLRQYNSHQDTQKVKYEHAILQSLTEQKREFVIPQLVHTLEGDTYIQSAGKIGALFRYQEGSSAQLSHANLFFQLGNRAGQLSRALSNITVSLAPVYSPYYKLDLAYPECPPEDFIQFIHNHAPLFRLADEEVLHISREIEQLFRQINQLTHLPHQIVHGDLNASNILVNEKGDIAVILDFEFATWDLRVMELAVPLADMISGMILVDDQQEQQSEEVMWKNIEALISGYKSEIELLQAELDLVPSLVLLRRVDVVMHFVTRYNKGIDPLDVAIEQLKQLILCIRWLGMNRERLQQLL